MDAKGGEEGCVGSGTVYPWRDAPRGPCKRRGGILERGCADLLGPCGRNPMDPRCSVECAHEEDAATD